MQFQEENLSEDLVKEVTPLLMHHYEEIAQFQDIKLKPDWTKYEKLSENKMLRIYTARKESVLVGYCVFLVSKNIHYSDSIQALQDVLFIHPDHRGTGGRFIIWCDRRLKELGVEVVYHHMKERSNFGALLKRLNYVLMDLVYAKRL